MSRMGYEVNVYMARMVCVFVQGLCLSGWLVGCPIGLIKLNQFGLVGWTLAE